MPWEVIAWSDPENSGATSSEWVIGAHHDFGETLKAKQTSFWGDVMLRESWISKYFVVWSLGEGVTMNVLSDVDVDRVEPLTELQFQLSGATRPTNLEIMVDDPDLDLDGKFTITKLVKDGDKGYTYNPTTGELTIKAGALPEFDYEGDLAKQIEIVDTSAKIVKAYHSGETESYAQYATLKEAVDAATAGDTIEICANTSEKSAITVNKNLTITSKNGGIATYTGSQIADMITVADGVTLTLDGALIDGKGTCTNTINSGTGTLIVNGGGVMGGEYNGISFDGALHIANAPTLSMIEMVSKSGVIVKDGSLTSSINLRLNDLSKEWSGKNVVISGTVNVEEADKDRFIVTTDENTLSDLGMIFTYYTKGDKPTLKLETDQVEVTLSPITVFASETASDRVSTTTLKDALGDNWSAFANLPLYVIGASGFTLSAQDDFTDANCASWGYDTANTKFGLTATVDSECDVSTGAGTLTTGLTGTSALTVTALNGNALTITDTETPYASVELTLCTTEDGSGNVIHLTVNVKRKASSINVTVPLVILVSTNLDGGTVSTEGSGYAIANNSSMRIQLAKAVEEAQDEEHLSPYTGDDITSVTDHYRINFTVPDFSTAKQDIASKGTYNPIGSIEISPLSFVTKEDAALLFSSVTYTVEIPQEDAE